MKTYKGFNPDMTCRTFKYKQGEEYETDTAVCCRSGFHACEMPLDCFKYYQPSKSIYCEVEQGGDISKGDDKISSTKIKIGARLSIEDIVRAQIDLVFDKIKKSKNKSENQNNCECAATSGEESSAATSGNGSSAATSGDGSSAATSNKNAIVLACGKKAKAKGVKGSYLVLTEWNEDSTELLCAKMERVDGEKIKENIWYVLQNGEFVEVSEN